MKAHIEAVFKNRSIERNKKICEVEKKCSKISQKYVSIEWQGLHVYMVNEATGRQVRRQPSCS